MTVQVEDDEDQEEGKLKERKVVEKEGRDDCEQRRRRRQEPKELQPCVLKTGCCVLCFSHPNPKQSGKSQLLLFADQCHFDELREEFPGVLWQPLVCCLCRGKHVMKGILANIQRIITCERQSRNKSTFPIVQQFLTHRRQS